MSCSQVLLSRSLNHRLIACLACRLNSSGFRWIRRKQNGFVRHILRSDLICHDWLMVISPWRHSMTDGAIPYYEPNNITSFGYRIGSDHSGSSDAANQKAYNTHEWVASLLNASFEITRIVQGPGVLHPWISCCVLVSLLISPFFCFIMDFWTMTPLVLWAATCFFNWSQNFLLQYRPYFWLTCHTFDSRLKAIPIFCRTSAQNSARHLWGFNP